MKMKRIFILCLIALLIWLIIMLFVFVKSIIECVAISIPLILILCSFIYIFVIDCFVGKKEYVYKDAMLIIKRKNKILIAIKQSDVKKMKVYYDCINEKEIYRISFKCKKKYIIHVTENNKDALENFISKMEYRKAKNYLYYFLSIFTH